MAHAHNYSMLPPLYSVHVTRSHFWQQRLIVIFDSGHPDVLVVLQQQIKGTSNTSTFIKDDWLHVSTLIGSSSGLFT